MPYQNNTPKSPQWINYVFASLLCLLPFIYSGKGVDPVLLPRQIAVSVFVLMVSLGLMIKGRPVNGNLLTILYVALPVIYFASILQAINSVEALYIIVKISLFSCLFLVLYASIKQGLLSLKTITLAVAISGVVATLWAIRDMVALHAMGIPVFEGKNIYKVNASFGHKNLLSSYIFLCMPMLLVQWNFYNKKSWRLLIVLGLLLMLCVILLLQTRAVLLAFCVSMPAGIALLIFRFSFRKEASKKVAIICMLLCLVFAGLFLYVNRSKLNVITRTESFVERVNLWNNTWQMILENPLTGVGAANWQIHFPKYGIEKFYEMNYTISEGLTTFQRPHNDFLWVWAETGLPGLVVYAGLFIVTLIFVWKLVGREKNTSEKPVYAAFFIQVLSFIVISLVDFPLERIEHPLIIISSMAPVGAAYVPANPQWKVKTGKAFWIVSIIVAFFSVYLAMQRWESERQLKKMHQAHAAGNWQKLIKEGVKAQTAYFTMDYYSIPVMWYVGVGQFMQNNIAAARVSFEQAFAINPWQVHVLNNYGACFEKEGNHKRAIGLLEEAHRISPTFSDGIINLSGAYFNAGRYDDAYRTITRFKYDRHNDRFRTFALAIIKVKLENTITTEKNKVMIERMTKLMQDDGMILSLYQEAQQSGEDFMTYVKRTNH